MPNTWLEAEDDALAKQAAQLLPKTDQEWINVAQLIHNDIKGDNPGRIKVRKVSALKIRFKRQQKIKQWREKGIPPAYIAIHKAAIALERSKSGSVSTQQNRHISSSPSRRSPVASDRAQNLKTRKPGRQPVIDLTEALEPTSSSTVDLTGTMKPTSSSTVNRVPRAGEVGAIRMPTNSKSVETSRTSSQPGRQRTSIARSNGNSNPVGNGRERGQSKTVKQMRKKRPASDIQATEPTFQDVVVELPYAVDRNETQESDPLLNMILKSYFHQQEQHKEWMERNEREHKERSKREREERERAHKEWMERRESEERRRSHEEWMNTVWQWFSRH